MTGARAGLAIEPRKAKTRVPTLSKRRKAILPAALVASRREALRGLRPRHARNLRAREPGGPVAARARGLRAGRRGNAEAVIPGWTAAGSRISS